MEQVTHPIAPVYDGQSKILILGSFPSVQSRKAAFFYGHPQNRFWRVVSGVLGVPRPKTAEEKRRTLLRAASKVRATAPSGTWFRQILGSFCALQKLAWCSATDRRRSGCMNAISWRRPVFRRRFCHRPVLQMLHTAWSV